MRRLVIAVDAGLVINPDGAANQIEGGAVQATSWTLKERVRFDRFSVTSDTWETYPILRFSEVPAIEVEFVGGRGNAPLGIGECAQGPTAAAIANAVCDALGVRVRSLPLTAEQLIAAMPDNVRLSHRSVPGGCNRRKGAESLAEVAGMPSCMGNAFKA